MAKNKRSSGIYLVIPKDAVDGHCYVILPPEARNPTYFVNASDDAGIYNHDNINPGGKLCDQFSSLTYDLKALQIAVQQKDQETTIANVVQSRPGEDADQVDAASHAATDGSRRQSIEQQQQQAYGSRGEDNRASVVQHSDNENTRYSRPHLAVAGNYRIITSAMVNFQFTNVMERNFSDLINLS